MIDAIIGNFRVIRQLGKGGMGEVWLAEHKEIRTKVAIKMLLPHISADKQQVQRFFNEAVAVSRIKHAGIVKIFDVGFREGGEAYLVMEFLEGESLASRIRRSGRLPLAQVADIGRQIAGVLEATHTEGITHRDLKPDNIYLVSDSELASGERVKVLDFGIAKLGGSTVGLTGAGTMGTPAYMSPEQWQSSSKVDGRADLYSLGCLAFEMVCGRPPFLVESIGEACNLHLNQPPPSPRSLVGELPVALESLLTRLLAKEPHERPAVRDVKLAFAELGNDPQLAKPNALAPVSVVAPSIAPTVGSPPSFRGLDTTLGASAASIAAPVSVAPAKRSRVLAAIVGTAVVIGGAVGLVKLRSGDESTAAAITPAIAVIPSPAKPVAVPDPPPRETPQPPPVESPVATIQVRIKTVPATAELRIDDDVVRLPFEHTFPQSGDSHRVEVRAAGYRVDSRAITFEANRDLVIKLEPIAPVAPPPIGTKPLIATKPEPAKPVTPEPAKPVELAPISPEANGKPIYKGTKGTIITDYPSNGSNSK